MMMMMSMMSMMIMHEYALVVVTGEDGQIVLLLACMSVAMTLHYNMR